MTRLPLVLAVVHALARQARSPAKARHEVRPGKRMPTLAVRLLGVRRLDRNAAHHVLARAHRLQVVGVDARRVATEMVEVKPLWDRADEQLVNDPVRSL